MPADVLAPNGARPSAGTVLTTKLDRSLNINDFVWFLLVRWRWLSNWPKTYFHLNADHAAVMIKAQTLRTRSYSQYQGQGQSTWPDMWTRIITKPFLYADIQLWDKTQRHECPKECIDVWELVNQTVWLVKYENMFLSALVFAWYYYPYPWYHVSWWCTTALLHLLTHWGLVTPYGKTGLGQHWLR